MPHCTCSTVSFALELTPCDVSEHRWLTVLYGRVALALKVCWCGRVRAHANQYAGVNESRACRLLIGRPELGNVLPPFWSFADRIGTAKIQGTAGRGWGFFGFGFGVYPKSP